jgi:hypothetical protein
MEAATATARHGSDLGQRPGRRNPGPRNRYCTGGRAEFHFTGRGISSGCIQAWPSGLASHASISPHSCLRCFSALGEGVLHVIIPGWCLSLSSRDSYIFRAVLDSGACGMRLDLPASDLPRCDITPSPPPLPLSFRRRVDAVRYLKRAATTSARGWHVKARLPLPEVEPACTSLSNGKTDAVQRFRVYDMRMAPHFSIAVAC